MLALILLDDAVAIVLSFVLQRYEVFSIHKRFGKGICRNREKLPHPPASLQDIGMNVLFPACYFTMTFQVEPFLPSEAVMM